MADKTRYWCAICYPENMKDDWEETIGDILQLPYAYALHDKDMLARYKIKKGEDYQRKPHVHLIIVFPNTTTQSHALNVVLRLSKDGACCASTIKAVINIRHAYEYLIHNTETAKKQKKYQYDRSAIVAGNNFDIGAYEQTSLADKRRMRRELSWDIISKGFTNYFDFYTYVISNYDDDYEDIVTSYSGHFERMVKGCYHRGISKPDDDCTLDEDERESEEVRERSESDVK